MPLQSSSQCQHRSNQPPTPYVGRPGPGRGYEQLLCSVQVNQALLAECLHWKARPLQLGSVCNVFGITGAFSLHVAHMGSPGTHK
jgi:hypothetical protein